jgi:hypothetical protein
MEEAYECDLRDYAFGSGSGFCWFLSYLSLRHNAYRFVGGSNATTLVHHSMKSTRLVSRAELCRHPLSQALGSS